MTASVYVTGVPSRVLICRVISSKVLGCLYLATSWGCPQFPTRVSVAGMGATPTSHTTFSPMAVSMPGKREEVNCMGLLGAEVLPEKHRHTLAGAPPIPVTWAFPM